MILKYKILWFEDSHTFVDSLSPRIKAHLESLEFDTNIQINPGSGDVIGLVTEYDPDLILIDYDLGEGSKGDTFLTVIRRNELYTDIVFYSQHTDFLAKVGGLLEGAFFTERNNLYEKTCKIIDLTIKKQQDVNNIRGIIIAETIYLERKIDDFTRRYFGPDEEKRAAFDKILDPTFGALMLSKKCDLINHICKEKIKALTKVSDKAEQTEKVEINIKKSNLEKIMSQFKNIYSDIIEIRDIMAHAEESSESRNTLISRIGKKKTIIVNDEFCKESRRNIKKHSGNLDELTTLFESLP